MSDSEGTGGERGGGRYRTSDALAEDALQSMLIIEAGYSGGLDSPTVRAAASALAGSCADLLRTGPPQYRREFGELLPLTELELDLLQGADVAHSPKLDQDLATRFGEWITRSPIAVDSRTVHVAAFLERLWPSLGLWEDRMRADEMIERVARPH